MGACLRLVPPSFERRVKCHSYPLSNLTHVSEAKGQGLRPLPSNAPEAEGGMADALAESDTDAETLAEADGETAL